MVWSQLPPSLDPLAQLVCWFTFRHRGWFPLAFYCWSINDKKCCVCPHVRSSCFTEQPLSSLLIPSPSPSLPPAVMGGILPTILAFWRMICGLSTLPPLRSQSPQLVPGWTVKCSFSSLLPWLLLWFSCPAAVSLGDCWFIASCWFLENSRSISTEQA